MRLLICTLYFPPCTFTPANRIYSWAKYLNRFGIYPVIITRQWLAEIDDDFYLEKPVGDKVYVEKHADYEVHYLPFDGNYRTRSLGKRTNILEKIVLKITTAIEMLFRYSSTSVLPYGNLVSYALKYVKDNKVDKILISGSPFLLFKIGYSARKKFGIPWVADYRDGWTTDNYGEIAGLLTKPVRFLNRYFEKKWLSNAAGFTTVSEFLKSGLESHLGIKGHVVYNGFFNDLGGRSVTEINKKSITFLYSGIVYPKQDYRTVVAVFKKLIDTYAGTIDIKLLFLGTTYENPTFANDPVFNGYDKNILLMNRVNYADALKMHELADVFIMLSHQGMKGIVSSKVFDYIKYNRPVVLFRNDKDVLEEILVGSNLAVIADDEIELEQKITELVKQKIDHGSIALDPNFEYINSFSRENQVRKLAEILKDK